MTFSRFCSPRIHRLAALLLLGLVPVSSALAQGIEDPAAIDRDVAAFTGQPIGAPGGAARPVDRRLRLAACGGPLALSWRGDAHASILVECPDAGGWHIYVATSAPPAGPTRQTAAAPVIERGQGVTVAVTGDGFSVSQPAEALESGAIGAWIRVRTQAKSDPIQAQVMRPGLVEVRID
jgi:flagella basal body P-ring formation protein FlgA